MAKMNRIEIPSGKGLMSCLECSRCSAKCTYSLDLDQRINDLKALYAHEGTILNCTT